MCLTTGMKECLVADNPIRCYKIVVKAGDCFMSVVHKFEYTLGETYKLRPSSVFPEKNDFLYFNVHEGFHSYAHAKHANEDCDDIDRADVPNLESFIGEVMLLCEIPKGAKYWIGNNGFSYGKDYAEYCSNSLKVIGWKMKYEKNWRKYVPYNK